tara:strand:- start:632 stop:2200 length:1569 start_codon:yes stop_codon:yes gene_type:complete
MKKTKVFFIKIYEIIRWIIITFRHQKKKNFLKKQIIFVELCTSLTTIKVNCLLALSLSKNFNLKVIFPSKSLFYESFYRAIGIKNFIYLDQPIDSKIKKKITNLWDKIRTSKEFLDFEYESIRSGKFIASKILRESVVGKFDFCKIDKNKIKDYFINSISKIENFKLILKENNIQFLIFNERGYTPAGEIFELALKKKIRCIQWFGSPIDNCHSLKCYTWNMRSDHPLKLLKNSLKRLSDFDKKKKISSKVMQHLKEQYFKQKGFNRQNLQKNKIILNKFELKEKLKISNNFKICTIFTHIFDDATFFYGDSLFSSYEDWLKNILIFTKNKKDINWIVKVHPANELRHGVSLEEKLIDQIYKKIPKNVKIIKPSSNINTFSFFESTDVALTVRGTVGCELACFGVPVITAGTGRYSHQGFTLDPKTKKEFFNYLNNINNIKKISSKKIKLARIYTYGSLIGRSIKMDGININYNYNGISLEKSNVVEIPKTYDELIKKSDIKKIIYWIKNKSFEDLMDLEQG